MPTRSRPLRVSFLHIIQGLTCSGMDLYPFLLISSSLKPRRNSSALCRGYRSNCLKKCRYTRSRTSTGVGRTSRVINSSYCLPGATLSGPSLCRWATWPLLRTICLKAPLPGHRREDVKNPGSLFHLPADLPPLLVTPSVLRPGN